ncbi:UDP-N-acetylmuramate dehydrogenase [bacterium]|nr:UDP-N-acetylmuramate dehydrogenase [bacterium]
MQKVLTEIKDFVKKVEYKAPLAPYTSFKIGGPAEVMVTIEKPKELETLIKFINENDLDYFVLGEGTNVLVSDKGYKGIVIKFGNSFTKIKTDKSTLIVGSATLLRSIIKKASESGLSGIEHLAGIPGSLGGAVKMNASAWETEISQAIIRIDGYNSQGEKIEYIPRESDWGYRKFKYEEIAFITSCSLRLNPFYYKRIKEKIDGVLAYRKSSQPANPRSAGCVFKNPRYFHAGKIIEKLDLKGYKIGGAQVSEEHANFIINLGKAKASDVNKMIEEIQARVLQKFGIKLELEIIKLGEF